MVTKGNFIAIFSNVGLDMFKWSMVQTEQPYITINYDSAGKIIKKSFPIFMTYDGWRWICVDPFIMFTENSKEVSLLQVINDKSKRMYRSINELPFSRETIRYKPKGFHRMTRVKRIEDNHFIARQLKRSNHRVFTRNPEWD